MLSGLRTRFYGVSPSHAEKIPTRVLVHGAVIFRGATTGQHGVCRGGQHTLLGSSHGPLRFVENADQWLWLGLRQEVKRHPLISSDNAGPSPGPSAKSGTLAKAQAFLCLRPASGWVSAGRQQGGLSSSLFSGLPSAAVSVSLESCPPALGAPSTLLSEGSAGLPVAGPLCHRSCSGGFHSHPPSVALSSVVPLTPAHACLWPVWTSFHPHALFLVAGSRGHGLEPRWDPRSGVLLPARAPRKGGAELPGSLL